jgi:hypothetical protein
MNSPHRGLVALGVLLCCAGCVNQLTGPTFEGDSGGGTVAIAAVTPRAGTILEPTMFPNVTIEYTLTSTVQEPGSGRVLAGRPRRSSSARAATPASPQPRERLSIILGSTG